MRITVAAMAIMLATGCGSGVSSEQADPGYQSNEPAPLDHLSNRGTPFSSLLTRDEQALSRMHQHIVVEDISILGTRGDRSFYRLSDHCYGSGPASPTDHVFSQIICGPAFPSRDVPVLDATAYSSTAVSPEERLQPHTRTILRSEGIAADGVARVALVGADGQVVAETPVLDNIYSFERVPAGNGLELVAYSATGEVVFSQP